ncbi:hypothetical protein DIS16_10850 [Levilactobacillus brevis]|uniref:hypothetical protein n=1 Tax=Levilactobacillus brevis TaxID=1580 RepID=UPI001120EA58|nr:hypothetical protein [Levilactobacillus brevis]TOY74929.1 hypothetical protein DIS16_10850 [Levilactobacillus brevis]
MMTWLSKHVAGQSIRSWGLQVGLICIAWLVSDHQLDRSMWTLGLAAVLTILTYMSLAKDAQQRSDEK